MGKRRLARGSSVKEKRAAWTAWKSWVYLGILALALLGIVAFLAMQGPAGIAKIGRPAPDFTLYQLNGQKVTLSSLRGHPVLVDFWGAT
jgi:cytochrome c biogenesis protein CcmG, thiol:disulfide interchange protein DsbE